MNVPDNALLNTLGSDPLLNSRALVFINIHVKSPGVALLRKCRLLIVNLSIGTDRGSIQKVKRLVFVDATVGMFVTQHCFRDEQ